MGKDYYDWTTVCGSTVHTVPHVRSLLQYLLYCTNIERLKGYPRLEKNSATRIMIGEALASNAVCDWRKNQAKQVLFGKGYLEEFAQGNDLNR